MAWSASMPALELLQVSSHEYNEKGDKHLQTLFIHGVRAVVRVATNNNDVYLNQWVKQLKESREFNKTTVEIANKYARIIWSMLINDTEYQAV